MSIKYKIYKDGELLQHSLLKKDLSAFVNLSEVTINKYQAKATTGKFKIKDFEIEAYNDETKNLHKADKIWSEWEEVCCIAKLIESGKFAIVSKIINRKKIRFAKEVHK